MMTIRIRSYFLLAIIISSLLLTGCDDKKRLKALQAEIAKLRHTAEQSKKNDSIIDLELPRPIVYSVSGISASSSVKSNVSKQVMTGGNPLEDYPFKEYQFVGILTQGDKISAYILAPDGMIYQASVGDVLGSNHGKISKINSDHLQVLEKFTDSSNQQVERTVILELKEDKDEQPQ